MVPEMEMGGVEQGTYDLVEGFVKRGHKVFLLSHGGKMIPSLKEKGVNFFSLPLHKKDPFSFFYSLYKSRDIFKMIKPDIVHARSRVPAWVGYYATKPFPSIHFITSFHSFYNRHFPSRIMGRGERVIVVSKSLSEYAVKYFGVKKEKIRVVYNGVKLGRIPERKRKLLITMGIMGRLSEGKGFEPFIKIFKGISEKYTHIKGIMGLGVSDKNSSYLKKIKELVEKNSLKEKIEILVNPKKEEFFSKIDIYVAPVTKPEGFGRTIAESQLAGIPIVGKNIGAMGEIVIHQKTGFLVNGGLDEFILYVAKLIEDENLRKKMGKEGMEYVSNNFTVEKMIERTLSVYEEVLSKRYVKI